MKNTEKKKNKFLPFFLTLLILTILSFTFAKKTDILSFFKKDKCKGPYITFTFDDGYEDVYKFGLPIFKKYDVAATVFVIPARIGKHLGRDRLMNWEHLKSLQDSGWGK